MALTDSELLQLLEALPEDSLDSSVHDMVSRGASAINNEGYEGQVRYLQEQGLSNEEILESAGGVVPQDETATLTLEIKYDSSITDAESIGSAIDTLLETALSTEGILSEYGTPHIGQTFIQPRWVEVIEDLMPEAFTEGSAAAWYSLLASRIKLGTER